MRIQSPLSNLRDVLAQVRSSASTSRTALAVNEAATRAALIDPVLRALGWDTANIYMVEVERTLGQTRADYALYENGGAVKVIIEAKKLGDNLAQHDVKLVHYAFTFKLASIFLTDGLAWMHYTSFNPANFEPTKILNIVQDDLGEVAAYLVQHLDAALLWPEDQTVDTLSRQLAQLQSDMATLQQELASLRSVPSDRVRANRPVSVKASQSVDHTSAPDWTALDAIPPTTDLKPKLLRLPDGREVSISTWKQILVECCKFTLSHNPDVPVPLPDRSGKKVCLLNGAPFPDNISQLSLPYGDRTVYLYTNYDARNCVANALHILHKVLASQKLLTPAVVLR